MKKNNYIFILMLVSVLIQCFFYNNTSLNYQYTFAIGIAGLDDELHISTILPLLLPIFIALFAFNDDISDLINNSGKIYIIRNFSKVSLINKMIISIMVRIVLFTCLQIIIYSVLKGELCIMDFRINIRAIFLYMNVLLAIALFEQILQLFTPSVYVTLIMGIYVFIGNTFGILCDSYILKSALFPSLIFGLYNGSFGDIKVYIANFIFVSALNIFQYFLISYKFKRIDIF